MQTALYFALVLILINVGVMVYFHRERQFTAWNVSAVTFMLALPLAGTLASILVVVKPLYRLLHLINTSN